MAPRKDKPHRPLRTFAAVVALHLIGVSTGLPSSALALSQELSRLEQPPVRWPADAAERAAHEARNAELQALCAANDLGGFVNLLAQSPQLLVQRAASEIRRVDDSSDTRVPSEAYSDFPLEAVDWNFIRPGSERAQEGPQYLLIKTARQPGGVGQVFWFEASYDGEPLGDAPGTLIGARGPVGVLIFETVADGCWNLSQDIRGRRALSAFFDGS